MSETPSDSERIGRLEGEVASIRPVLVRLEKGMDALTAKSGQGTNWSLILSAIGVFLAILMPTVGALALFITLQISTSIAPLQSKAEVSSRDRGELHQASSALTALVTEINSRERESTAQFRAQMVEIESQFAAADHIRNLQNVHTMRMISLLWEKVYGQRFPSELQFYPNISQHER